MTTSRFITHPDVITKDKNTSIVLVDPTQNELSKVERFLQTSEQDFDVYIYYHKNDDLEYFYEEINHYKNLTDIQNAIILNKINIDEYFKIINNNKKYNQYIPFLIYKENNIIKKKDIICLVKKDIDTRDDYIRDYRLLSLDEINKILE